MTSVKKSDIAYLTALLIALALHYAIPFTVLKEARGFELFAYWSILVVVWALLTGIYIEKRVR